MFGFGIEDVVKVGGGIVTGAIGAKIASDITKDVTGSDTLSNIAGIAGGVAAGDLGMDLVSSFFDDNDEWFTKIRFFILEDKEDETAMNWEIDISTLSINLINEVAQTFDNFEDCYQSTRKGK